MINWVLLVKGYVLHVRKTINARHHLPYFVPYRFADCQSHITGAAYLQIKPSVLGGKVGFAPEAPGSQHLQHQTVMQLQASRCQIATSQTVFSSAWWRHNGDAHSCIHLEHYLRVEKQTVSSMQR